jgi:hypothetical protein
VPSRDFESRGVPTNDPDPITFTVAGRAFVGVPVVPPGLLTCLDHLPDLPAESDPTWFVAVTGYCTALAQFIRACIIPDERPDWDALILTEYLDASVFADVTAWLAQLHAQRLAAGMAPVEVPDEEEDPITARQRQLEADRWGIPDPEPITTNPALLQILEAGGGYTPL